MPWKLKDTIPPRPASVTDIIDGDLDEVTDLHLADKGLEVLPDDIDRLGNLERLYADHNFLTDLPASLAGVGGLHTLFLSRNAVRTFPPVLSSLQSLRALNLAFNPLEAVPAELGHQSDLAQLWLHKTQLIDLPPAIAELPLVSLGLPVWTDNTRAILPRLGKLRGLPPSSPVDDDEDDDGFDPVAARRALPETRPAPVAARVEGGRLVRLAEGVTAESQRQEFAAMHHEVRKRAEKVRASFGNHFGLLELIAEYLNCLGDTPETVQPIALGFAGQDLEIIGDGYRDEDGGDRLLPLQRALWKALVAGHGLLIAKVPEWRDYAAAPPATPPLPPEVVAQTAALTVALAQALRAQPAVSDPAIAAALDQVAHRAETAPAPLAPLAGKGLFDSDANVLSLLSREALKVVELVPAKAREKAAEGVIGLGMVAGGFLLGHAGEILALANSLPRDFGWLRAVVGALRAHWPL